MRSAAPFSKNKRKKNPKRPGRQPRQGLFRDRAAPSKEDYGGPPVEAPAAEAACPKCDDEFGRWLIARWFSRYKGSRTSIRTQRTPR
jgi:hypothetical protein